MSNVGYQIYQIIITSLPSETQADLKMLDEEIICSKK